MNKPKYNEKLFFRPKQNDIHSFKLIEYIAKNVKGEFANKLTAPKVSSIYCD